MQHIEDLVMGGVSDVWISVDAANVLSETIDGEVMVIDMRLGNYYSLSGVAGTIWNTLAEPRRLGDIVGVVRRQHSATPENVVALVQRFIDELAAEQLVATNNAPPSAEATPSPNTVTPTSATPFEVPHLEKYTDMQALLLVDPIHDVDVLGWPTRVRPT